MAQERPHRRFRGSPRAEHAPSRLRRAARAPAGRTERSEAGDTLIEILIAIVIIALTVTALMSGLVTALTSSTTEQSLATLDSVLNDFAQAAQYEVQQPGVFTNCTTGAYRFVSAPSPSSGPIGTEVTVFVTGFTPSTGLSVTLVSGSTSIPAPLVTSPTPTDPNGDATVTFTVPSGASGAESVEVSDGTATASPTAFTVVNGATKGTSPAGYKVSVNPVQQWDAQASSWVGTSGSCPKSGAQLITVVAHAPDGSGGSVSFVASGAATTTVQVTGSSSSSPATLGDTLTFTAKVVPPNSTTPAPTGGIQWSFTASPGNPSCNDSTLVTIAGTNTSKATCTLQGPAQPAQVGTYTVTASYPAPSPPSPTPNYGPGSGTGTITVGKANSTTTVSAAATPSPAQPGSALKFTATVGASPAVGTDPQPDGQVTWTLSGPPGSTPVCTPNPPGDTTQMTGNGTGTNTDICTVQLTNSSPTGTYSASASYGGDGNYTSSSSATPASITVSKATPTLTFTSTPSNPSPGSTVMVTVTVHGNGTITPGGPIGWTVTLPPGAPGTPPQCTGGTTLSGTGTATCSMTLAANAPTGSYTVAAAYGGDTAYTSASGSTPVSVTLPPAGLNIQTVGSPADNKPDNPSSGGNGDQIVFTYNQAMSATSIQRGWSGAQENVTVQLSRVGNQTQLSVCTGTFGCTPVNLGTVNLGDTGSSHYTNGIGTVSLTATMAMTANGSGQSVVTVTLTQSSPSLSAVAGNTTLVWTPSGLATNTATPALTCSTAPVTEAGAPKANF